MGSVKITVVVWNDYMSFIICKVNCNAVLNVFMRIWNTNVPILVRKFTILSSFWKENIIRWLQRFSYNGLSWTAINESHKTETAIIWCSCKMGHSYNGEIYSGICYPNLTMMDFWDKINVAINTWFTTKEFIYNIVWKKAGPTRNQCV